MSLSKKDIFSFDDVKYKTIKVRAWNDGELILKSMSAAEKVSWSKKVNAKNADELDYMIELIIISCVDSGHSKMFEATDKPALKNKSISAIQQIFEECINVSTLGATAVEEEAKN